LFDRVVAYLEGSGTGASGSFDSEDVRVALAALFFHMICIDGQVTDHEMISFRQLLASRFELDDARLDALAQAGEREDKASASLFPFTTILNHALSEDERREVLWNLRVLAYSDGTLHKLEADMMGHVSRLLKLS